MTGDDGVSVTKAAAGLASSSDDGQRNRRRHAEEKAATATLSRKNRATDCVTMAARWSMMGNVRARRITVARVANTISPVSVLLLFARS